MVNIQREYVEIIVGGVMLVASFLISFLMVIGVIEKSYVLSIITFISSFAGLLIGYHGIYGLIIARRKKG
ncbi:MAG: hypothetical protein N3E47_07355 [Candidatus Bathyarchaeota archaeon]|nr:hypothetical protein [Candidatus Bathyarchaeota archaeon]